MQLGPRAAGRSWTQADDVQLLALFASGMDAALIARELGLTAQAVRTRKRRLNNQRALLGLLMAARDFVSAQADRRRKMRAT
jgi:DNA-binding CsgD family transcriptional regulator